MFYFPPLLVMIEYLKHIERDDRQRAYSATGKTGTISKGRLKEIENVTSHQIARAKKHKHWYIDFYG
jgi:hypothetical protein